MWNSGRLENSNATVSSFFRPSPARPAARLSTRWRSWPHVMVNASPFVRMATSSGLRSTTCRTLPHPEARATEPSDVVGQPDHEQHDHEHEPDRAGALHDAERDRPAADLLRHGPEDVAAVERQEREQVPHREAQRDDRQDEDRLREVEAEALLRDL